MDNQNENIFNSVLYPYIENDCKIKEINEDSHYNDKDLKESFIDSEFFNIDFFNNNEKVSSLKEGKNNINEKINKKGKKKKKINKLKNYNIKKGDWLCPKCNNINFAFRTVCNICGINK